MKKGRCPKSQITRHSLEEGDGEALTESNLIIICSTMILRSPVKPGMTGLGLFGQPHNLNYDYINEYLRNSLLSKKIISKA